MESNTQGALLRKKWNQDPFQVEGVIEFCVRAGSTIQEKHIRRFIIKVGVEYPWTFRTGDLLKSVFVGLVEKKELPNTLGVCFTAHLNRNSGFQILPREFLAYREYLDTLGGRLYEVMQKRGIYLVKTKMILRSSVQNHGEGAVPDSNDYTP